MHVAHCTPEELQYFAELHHLPIVDTISGEVALIDTIEAFERVTGHTVEQDRYRAITAIRTNNADPDIVPQYGDSKFALNTTLSHIELHLRTGELRVGTGPLEDNLDRSNEAWILKRLTWLTAHAWSDHVEVLGRMRAANEVSEDLIADNLAESWSRKNAEGDWSLDNELVEAVAPDDRPQEDELDQLTSFASNHPGTSARLSAEGRAILFGPLIEVARYLAPQVRAEAIADREYLDDPDDITAELEEPRFEHIYERVIERWAVDCVDVTEWTEFAETEIEDPAFVWLRENDQNHRWAQEEAREFVHAWARLGWTEEASSDWERTYLAVAILYASPLHTGTWYRKSLDEESLRIVTAAKSEAWEDWRDSEEFDPEIDRFQIYSQVEERAGEIWSAAQDADFA